MGKGIADVASQLASVQANLAGPSAEHDQTLADCSSIQERLGLAQAELATLQQGQQGTQAANKVLALHDA
jgi:hypothetical protein